MKNNCKICLQLKSTITTTTTNIWSKNTDGSVDCIRVVLVVEGDYWTVVLTQDYAAFPVYLMTC